MRAIALFLLVAACTSEPAPNATDTLGDELAESAANGGDPMVRAALADPIMSDPTLSTRANIDTIRPPAQPYAAPIPIADVVPPADDTAATTSAPAPGDCSECQAFHDSLTLAALAERQPRAIVGDCANGLGYAAGWADRPTAALPLHPAARVIEAAGNDANGCHLRIARFVVARPARSLIDWYFAQARRSGDSFAHRADGEGLHMLDGAKRGDRWRVFVEIIADNRARVTTIVRS